MKSCLNLCPDVSQPWVLAAGNLAVAWTLLLHLIGQLPQMHTLLHTMANQMSGSIFKC